jgi:hypothetical protein
MSPLATATRRPHEAASTTPTLSALSMSMKLWVEPVSGPVDGHDNLHGAPDSWLDANHCMKGDRRLPVGGEKPPSSSSSTTSMKNSCL